MSDGTTNPVRIHGKTAGERHAYALGLFFKALKALSFYPEDHPLREEGVSRAHQVLSQLLEGGEILVAVSRHRFTTDDGGIAVDESAMTAPLAGEFFARRIRRIVFLPDLSRADLRKFMQLLLLPPDRIHARGGMDALLASRFVTTIWINEIDLNLIREKRDELERAREMEGIEEVAEQVEELPPPPPETEMEVEELLPRMAAERSDDAYLRMAGSLAEKLEALKQRSEIDRLLAAALALFSQASGKESPLQRQHASLALRRLLSPDVAQLFLRRIEPRDFPGKQELMELFVSEASLLAPLVVRRLAEEENLHTRKMLADLLIRSRQEALPAVLPMLADSRWYVVRNMAVILGEIGASEQVEALRGITRHENGKVRNEAVRSIARIGGSTAEEALLSLLDEGEDGMLSQVILSLGLIRSRRAVPRLIDILQSRDMFLERLAVKKEAVLALGRIGDRSVTPYLLRLLTGRHILGRRKWEEMKVAAARALAQLRDETALPLLKELAEHDNAVGRACSDAADAIERLSREAYE